MEPDYRIPDEERPYVEFERVRNRKMKPRAEKRRVGRDGKERVRLAHPGATKEVWRKYLIGRMGNGMQEPYIFVTKEWLIAQIKPDCKPVSYGNFDKLPANYPAEWRRKLQEAVSAVVPHIESHKAVLAAEQRAAEAEKRAKEAEERASRATARANRGEGSDGKATSTASQ